MNTIENISTAIRSAGYRSEAVVPGYAFADVLSKAGATRVVPLAAFTCTPPSYRSAALAVVNGEGRRAIDVVNEHRALGAPLLFVLEKDEVTVWQVRSSAPPRAIEKVKLDEISELFARNRTNWHPDAIHRAKSIGAQWTDYQLDFVDLGLLPAIEGEVHIKLDRLLVETLEVVRKAPGGSELGVRTLFRVVFRLLAAKVLLDRHHPNAQSWDANDITSVLAGIERYYALGPLEHQKSAKVAPLFNGAWQALRGGINFSNISSDDLAFVYENTLVTPETRKLFGTHSTPRQVAEFVVQRLELHKHRPEDLRIYEPFAGAGVFLVSALRHLRDLLPVEWSDQQRHDFLIDHISGDEAEPFACEVAILSLILADYPNHNDWQVKEVDLFTDSVLAERIASHNVIVCNPPFEAFNAADKERYAVARKTHSKAIAALNAAIDSKPLALGFVLPRSFILERQFAEQRRRIESLYSTVEIVKLPDGIFNASDVETSAVIARNLRKPDITTLTLRSIEVAERDRSSFLTTGQTTAQRELVRAVSQTPEGQLWIPPLNELWEYLDSSPKLISMLKPKRGLEWNYPQEQATSKTKKPGYRLGYAKAEHMQQYQPPRSLWLDFQHEHLRCAASHGWSEPKLIASATRLSRGPWRIGAFVDLEGLLCSQQFFGLRPRSKLTTEQLVALCGVLNGPVANAYLAINSPQERFRAEVVWKIPIPASLPVKLTDLVRSYLELLCAPPVLEEVASQLTLLLAQIDAAVIEAYDLPLRLERQLLAFFEDSKRPVAHTWTHWNAAYPTPGLSLAERVSGRFDAAGNWVSKVFKPLPEDQVSLLRDYGS